MQPKDPLLCLTLSTPSFLECNIIDVATTCPLYRIKTSGTTTTVKRAESVSSFVVASSIKWPKIIPMMRTKSRPELVLVLMRDGPWRGGNSLLKPGATNHSRKFRLPNYDNPMKWKLHGNQYWCTSPSVYGPIATLDPRRGNHPPKLTVYRDLQDKYKPRQPGYGSVPILLLDYLVVTALLLVTDLQEWALVPRPTYSDVPRSDQEEFGPGANSAMWKGDALRSHRLESSSSITTIRTGPSRNPSTTQAGSSHGHSHQMPHSPVETDSDTENEHRSQWRRSLSPVSEAPRLAIEPESFHHRGSAVPSSPASDNLRKLLQQPTRGLITQPLRPAPRSSVVANDKSVLPSVLHMVHPFQRLELERDQHPYRRATPQISRANSVGNPRPLPLPPIPHVPDESSAGELGATLLRQHRSARVLPSIPRQLNGVPGLHTRAVSEVHPALLDDLSSQNSQAICPTDDVYSPKPVSKTSRVTQWLNSLTGDSSTAEGALELLLRASIFDPPPPAYNSLGFVSSV